MCDILLIKGHFMTNNVNEKIYLETYICRLGNGCILVQDDIEGSYFISPVNLLSVVMHFVSC